MSSGLVARPPLLDAGNLYAGVTEAKRFAASVDGLRHKVWRHSSEHSQYSHCWVGEGRSLGGWSAYRGASLSWAWVEHIFGPSARRGCGTLAERIFVPFPS